MTPDLDALRSEYEEARAHYKHVYAELCRFEAEWHKASDRAYRAQVALEAATKGETK